jgi:hypothetical protein
LVSKLFVVVGIIGQNCNTFSEFQAENPVQRIAAFSGVRRAVEIGDEAVDSAVAGEGVCEE